MMARFISRPVSSAVPNLSVRQHGFDIFAGVSGQGDLEIVDRGRAVHGERRREPRRIRSSSTGARPHLMTWPPMPQMNALPLRRAACDSRHDCAEAIGRQECGRDRAIRRCRRPVA